MLPSITLWLKRGSLKGRMNMEFEATNKFAQCIWTAKTPGGLILERPKGMILRQNYWVVRVVVLWTLFRHTSSTTLSVRKARLH